MKEWHEPSGQTDYLSQQHLLRYEFAAGYVWSGARVLDIACGPGYGTYCLSKCEVDIIGMDYDDNVIQAARAQYPGINFRRGDALELPFEDSAFDIVVSFETIEHIVDGGAFLDEIQRVLVPGGVLIVSTPNVKYTMHPAYHVKEYTVVEFFDLLENHVISYEKFGQYFLAKDYFVDFLRRLTPRFFVRGFDKIRLKQKVLKLLTAKDVVESKNSVAARKISPYSVVPVHVTNQHLLRIMIGVARMKC